MLIINRSLVCSAVFAAALALASCSEGTADTPQAATAAPRRVSVYFDVGKSGLTPEAQKVIAQAIAEANPDTSLKLSAVADRSNGKLSERRAETVRAALIAGGIPPERIAEARAAYGPPTPGVRDPRDRMVEISFE